MATVLRRCAGRGRRPLTAGHRSPDIDHRRTGNSMLNLGAGCADPSLVMPHRNGFAEIRARKALQEAGLPHDGPLARANSTRNEVFIATDHVIRFNQMPNQRLSREAALCHSLPDHSWTPEVVAYGGRPGSDYLIVSRRPGNSLSRCWPHMARAERKDAIQQFTRYLRELHRLPACDRVPAMDWTPHLLGGETPTAALMAGLDRLDGLPGIDRGLVAGARDIVADIGDCLADFDDSRLVHGDLSLENVLWDGRTVTAIVDFEWCRGGPADLDLDVLARYFAIPHAHVSAEAERWQRPEDYDEVPGWMATVYPELFSHPRLEDRLLIFALAFEVRDTLSNPPPANKRDLDELHPYYRLDHLVATEGHVGTLLDHLNKPLALS